MNNESVDALDSISAGHYERPRVVLVKQGKKFDNCVHVHDLCRTDIVRTGVNPIFVSFEVIRRTIILINFISLSQTLPTESKFSWPLHYLHIKLFRKHTCVFEQCHLLQVFQ